MSEEINHIVVTQDVVVESGTEDFTYCEHKLFDSVSAGNYWRALKDIEEEGIVKGETLLIESIKYVDGEVHNLFLRAHPLKYGKTIEMTVGGEQRYISFRTHRFLIFDFVKLFVYEPDHESIREKEMEGIQSEVDSLNQELLDAQINPDILNRVIDEELAKEVDGKSCLPVPVGDVEIPVSFSQALTSKPTTEAVKAMTIVAEKHIKIANIKAGWMADKTNAITKTLNKVVPFYKEKAAAAIALTDETVRRVNKIQRGVQSLYLYTGKGVDIYCVAKGVSAPKDVPLTLCSRKLFVDEELAVYLDVDEWFDFTDSQKFYNAIADNPGLIDQIFPTQRCMLIMANNRQCVEYKDPYVASVKNHENRLVFLMVRDGQNVHVVWSPVSSHLGSSRLFPTQDDSDSIFRGMDGSNISYDDISYTDSLEEHEIFELHYKRWLILCAGLDDREKLFGDFYPGEAGLDFVTLEFQNKYMRFIDDTTGLVEDRPSVESWINHQNKYTQSGSRVYMDIDSAIDRYSAPGAYRYSTRSGDYNRVVDVPYDAGHEVYVVNRVGNKLNVKVSLSRCYSEKMATVNINLNKVEWVFNHKKNLPFLCLDRIKVDELKYYIHNRQARIGHLSYIRLFKKALVEVELQIKKEESVRKLLLESVVNIKGVDINNCERLVDEAIYAYRAFNRGGEVCDLSPVDKGNWNILLNHAYIHKNKEFYCEQIKAIVVGMGYEPLRISISGNSSMKVYYSPLVDEQDSRLQPHAWVHKANVNLRKTKVSLAKPVWASLILRNATETIVKDYDGVESWIDKDDCFGSFNKKQKAFNIINKWQSSFAKLSLNAGGVRQVCEETIKYYNASQYKKKFVEDTGFKIPIGYELTKEGIVTVCLVVNDALLVLASKCNDSALLAELRDAFVGVYANKSHAHDLFNTGLSSVHHWEIRGFRGLMNDELHCKGWGSDFFRFLDVDKLSAHTPLPSERIKLKIKDQNSEEPIVRRIGALKDSFVFADGIVDSEYKSLDDVLDVSLPDNYEPYKVVSINADLVLGEEAFKAQKCIDIAPYDLDWQPFENNKEQSGFYPNYKVNMLMASRYVEYFYTKDEAMKKIKGDNWVLSSELPGYPQPGKDGVLRYYLITQSKKE